jgi:hypothetical protein
MATSQPRVNDIGQGLPRRVTFFLLLVRLTLLFLHLNKSLARNFSHLHNLYHLTLIKYLSYNSPTPLQLKFKAEV